MEKTIIVLGQEVANHLIRLMNYTTYPLAPLSSHNSLEISNCSMINLAHRSHDLLEGFGLLEWTKNAIQGVFFPCFRM
jgi:hypothetical protein